MKRLASGIHFILFVLLFGATAGCEHVTSVRDFIPPDPPRNVATEAGDGFIDVFWDASPGADVAGYNVFVSSSYDGRYELIGSTQNLQFTDNDARNGTAYYYAVTAFDYDGNESDLSTEEAYDIPRPEGYGLVLNNFLRSPSGSGYDFSAYAALPYTDQAVDIYYENTDGQSYMDVPEDTDIQDVGPTSSILDIRVAPAAGWSTTHDVVLQVGHTYVVWTWDDHYAKFRVRSLSTSRVVFDWAYQLQRANPLMKRAPRPERQLPVRLGEHHH
jgi:hypothetical protein